MVFITFVFMILKRKTLMIEKTDEFFGPMSNRFDDVWFTCATPLQMYNEEVTMDKIKEIWPERDFEGVILVTIEINVKR
jgi:hypothetical protein